MATCVLDLLNLVHLFTSTQKKVSQISKSNCKLSIQIITENVRVRNRLESYLKSYLRSVCFAPLKTIRFNFFFGSPYKYEPEFALSVCFGLKV